MISATLAKIRHWRTVERAERQILSAEPRSNCKILIDRFRARRKELVHEALLLMGIRMRSRTITERIQTLKDAKSSLINTLAEIRNGVDYDPLTISPEFENWRTKAESSIEQMIGEVGLELERSGGK